MKIKTLLIIALLLCFFKTAISQSLIDSPKTSYYTYIYRISDKEAKKIYKKDFRVIDNSYFHTVVDSFPTGTDYTETLPPGHYIRAFVEESKLNVKIAEVPAFDVRILNNNTDLCIQVFDLEGNLITDATVRIGLRRLRFDEESATYRHKRSNRQGILHVKYNGLSGYYDLSRQYNNSLFNRTLGPVVYSLPARVIWRPVRYFVRLPFDGIISLFKGRPFGTIAETQGFFWRLKFFDFWYIIEDIEDYFWEKEWFSIFYKDYKGYMVFNKPKYQPGDTVKLKAFIVNQRGKPLDKELNLGINVDGKRIKLGEIEPYAIGGYKYEFFIHDSLNLQLDKRYKISLYDENMNVMNSFIIYEDYELSKMELNVRPSSVNHYKGQDFKLFIKGTDVNELNILDGRLQILIVPDAVNQLFAEKVFVPDTIHYLEIPLDPAKETEVPIYDSLFPQANIDYNVIVTLLTSDNQKHVENNRISYFHEKEDIEIELLNDSIIVNYIKNGLRVEREVSIYAYDNFENELFINDFITPVSIPYNSFYSLYEAKTESVSKKFNISHQPSLLQINAHRTHNRLNINVNNPRNLEFTYNIYRRNKEIDRGAGTTLDVSKKASRRQNYYISLRYIWGGKVKEENFKIGYNDKKLNITVKEPGLIFPGKNTTINLLVTDHKGKPVEGVDLTAYSMTSKFDYRAPILPDFRKYYREKKLVNNFSIKSFDAHSYNSKKLDFELWQAQAGLDTIEYFRFLYPESGFYKHSFDSPDNITQFSPYVFIDGESQAAHVVYVDNMPVYFSWTTNVKPYSFNVVSGYRNIRIRTSENSINIDSVYFALGKKTIISLNPQIPNSRVKVEPVEAQLSNTERNLLLRYMFPYNHTFLDRHAYLLNRNAVISLEPEYEASRIDGATYYAGPVSGYTTFGIVDGYSHRFNHEPYFNYEFSRNVIKMRSMDFTLIPKKLINHDLSIRLTDYVLTIEKLRDAWNKKTHAMRYSSYRIPYPTKTEKGYGSFSYSVSKYENENELKPLNSILINQKDHNFIRVYPGNYKIMHQLEAGNYSLILVFPESRVFVMDSIGIKANGTNYIHVIDAKLEFMESFSERVSSVIKEMELKEYRQWIQEGRTDAATIHNIVREELPYTGLGDVVQGYVTDELDGSGIPGATVIVKGTNFGVITDIDGNYSLNVPYDYNTLIFSFLGYKTEEIFIDGRSLINVELNADICKLEEVVVVGYGTQSRQVLTGSVTSLEINNMLQGLPAVLSDNHSIRVRGTSSIDLSANPLIIVDGVVFTGDMSNINPELIQGISYLSANEGIALYGSRASSGVVIISTKSGAINESTAMPILPPEFDDDFLNDAMMAGSVRDNFSDYAFWQPSLTTDEQGLASFEVTFPDDITSWQTHYLAMNGKKQSGQTSGLIKSYKPLMAQLSLPRFLVESDTAYAIGRVSNYLPDSILVNTSAEVNSVNVLSKNRSCDNVIVDTIQIVGSNDTINVKYIIEAENGFFDGESRNVEVFPLGIDESVGEFFALNNDTVIHLSFIENGDVAKIYARADILEVINVELKRLIRYKHLCNEQVASRLKALLLQKTIADFYDEQFKLDKDVDRAIKRLLDNRNDNGLWGWWKASRTSHWINKHVIYALAKADSNGYEVKWDKTEIYEKCAWELTQNISVSQKLQILSILKYLEPGINLVEQIDEILNDEELRFIQMLQALEIKQSFDKTLNIDTILDFKKETIFGNVYFANRESKIDLLDNEVQSTLIAYRILRNSKEDYDEILAQIRNYFFEIKRKGSWRNTYESSLIIETIMSDLIRSGPIEEPKLIFSGDLETTVNDFPFEIEVSPDSKITVEKTGTYPVYITGYQQFWNSKPEVKINDFSVITYFDGIDGNYLVAGQPVKLIAKVNVEKDAEYVMISIPIPGGCSYDKKPNRFRNESHREYFRNESVIYIEKLKAGEHAFEVDLMPRYTGNYVLNPAKVELMYFPLFNANNEIKRIEIK